MKKTPLFERPAMRELLRVFIAISISLLIGFFITLAVSKEPFEAYRTFLVGPLTRLNRAGEWIKESITLMLLGLSVSLVFKANLFSLGAEGQMLMGALVAGSISLFVPLPGYLRIPLALGAAGLSGFLWGAIPGFLKAKLKANEIVSTLMLNAIALRFYDYILIYFIKKPGAGYNASDFFPKEGVLPTFIPNLPFLQSAYQLFNSKANVTIMLYIALLAVFLVWHLMFRTSYGYELRILGVNEKFAAYGGINTQKTIILTFAISGILAGLAGAHLAMGIHQKLIANITVSLGFEGIVVALLARNNPRMVPISALAYGYLRAGADVMERSSDVSREMVLIIQAIIILLVTAERVLPMIKQRIDSSKNNNADLATGKPQGQAALTEGGNDVL
ncbi:MAG: ABC transporter permease [Anaerolineaceae bacterium]|nr:ABC transporter permease [Anaerolineaceae bacterium]